MLWSDANEHIVGGLQPIGMPPFKNGVNQLFGHFCSLMAFNFISQRVERTGQCMPCVIVCSFALHHPHTRHSCILEVGESHTYQTPNRARRGHVWPILSSWLQTLRQIHSSTKLAKSSSSLFNERFGEATTSLFMP